MEIQSQKQSYNHHHHIMYRICIQNSWSEEILSPRKCWAKKVWISINLCLKDVLSKFCLTYPISIFIFLIQKSNVILWTILQVLGCIDGIFWLWASSLPVERCHHKLCQVPEHASEELVTHLQGKEDEMVPAGLCSLPLLQVHQGVPDKQSNQGPTHARKLSRSQ